MNRAKKLLLTAILSVVTALVLCFGIMFAMPTKLASAVELSTEGWTLAHEGDSMFIGAGENASLNEDPENGEVVENMPNFH